MTPSEKELREAVDYINMVIEDLKVQTPGSLDHPYSYIVGYRRGFNEALHICKLAAEKEKLNIPSVGELEAAIYGKSTLEAAQMIHKMIGGE